MTRGRPLPDGLASLHLDRFTVARIRRHAAALASDIPPGWVATIDAAGLQITAQGPAVLAVLRDSLNATDPTFRAREIAPSQVLASTEGDGCAWAWLYSVSADGTPWLRQFEGAAKSRAVAEAAVLARMGR